MRDDKRLPQPSSRADVEAFIRRVRQAPGAGAVRGRLLFAMDATASREPTWDRACQIQGRMFEETGRLGGLDVQLCHYRGFLEFHASPWVADPQALLREMTAVRCAAGETQIGRVLEHAAAETRRRRLGALVFVGDCVEEPADPLAQQAGELGLLGVPAFLFQEGHDPLAESVFRRIATLTKGAYCRFDAGSAEQLRELLGAVAVYAAGGTRALAELSGRRGGLTLALSHQLGGKG
jgi:hypothetical protein